MKIDLVCDSILSIDMIGELNSEKYKHEENEYNIQENRTEVNI